MKFHKLLPLLGIFAFFLSCSDSGEPDEKENSMLIGTWQLISGEDQDGLILDYTSTCYTWEFTETELITIDYMDANCTEIFIENQGIIYWVKDNIIYVEGVREDITEEILELTETTLVTKGESEEDGTYFSDTWTFKRLSD